MQERILKKKRVLVRPNLAWAMSGLNYLETDCLPSHNGSIMNLKEYSCFYPPLIIIEISITYMTAPELKQLHVNTRDYIKDAQVINLEKVPCSTFY